MRKYSISIVLLISILVSTRSFAQTSETIDNKKLVELTEAKLGDDLIIDLIKTSPTNFECGLTAILSLKKQHVSERVITEMMKKCSSEKALDIDASNSNNPLYPHPSGIYVFTKTDTQTILKKLYTTVVTQEKAGGLGSAFASALSYGLAKSATKVAIDNPSANVKCKKDVVFYFYFDETATNNISLSNWWFSKATSPNEFTLIQLNARSKTREFKKDKSDSYTYQSGIDESQKVQFSFEEVKPGIFKVMPKKEIKPGEYCFIYSASVPAQYTNDKVFDFSVIK